MDNNINNDIPNDNILNENTNTNTNIDLISEDSESDTFENQNDTQIHCNIEIQHDYQTYNKYNAEEIYSSKSDINAIDFTKLEQIMDSQMSNQTLENIEEMNKKIINFVEEAKNKIDVSLFDETTSTDTQNTFLKEQKIFVQKKKKSIQNSQSKVVPKITENNNLQKTSNVSTINNNISIPFNYKLNNKLSGIEKPQPIIQNYPTNTIRESQKSNILELNNSILESYRKEQMIIEQQLQENSISTTNDNSENINKIFINPSHNIHHKISSKYIQNNQYTSMNKNYSTNNSIPAVTETQPQSINTTKLKKNTKTKLIHMTNKRFLD